MVHSNETTGEILMKELLTKDWEVLLKLLMGGSVPGLVIFRNLKFDRSENK